METRKIFIWPCAKVNRKDLNICLYYDSNSQNIVFSKEAIANEEDLFIHSVKIAVENNFKEISKGTKIIVCCKDLKMVHHFSTHLSNWRQNKYIVKGAPMKSAYAWEIIYQYRESINFVYKTTYEAMIALKFIDDCAKRLNASNEIMGRISANEMIEKHTVINRKLIKNQLKILGSKN